MVDIPEHLLLKTAEARAKALGISVEQALAEMRGEVEPTKIEKEPDVIEVTPIEVEVKETPAPAAAVKEAPAPALIKIKNAVIAINEINSGNIK